MRHVSTTSSAMLLSGCRPTPHDGSTPLIEDDSDIPHSSIRSTPCPPGRAATSPSRSEATRQLPSSTRATPGDADIPSQPRYRAMDLEWVPTTEEERNFKSSITSLRQKLEASTALVDRLHLRNEVARLENVTNEKKLQEVRGEQQDGEEKACMAAATIRSRQVVLGTVLCVLLLALLGYVNWSLFYSPEVSYVRQRRRAMLGL